MVEPSGENSPSPFEKCKYKILLVSMARVSDLLLYSLKREHQSLSEASFHYLNFTHCTKQNLRHYRQASSKLSIQQQKKKNIYLQEHTTTCHFSMILCALHFETLQLTNSFSFLQHCKGGHLVQLLTATDYQ